MNIVRCTRQCQSNRSNYCMGMPCFLGIPVKAKLRKNKSWEVKNTTLWAAIQDKGYSLAEFARSCDCSLRTLERWVYQGLPPKEHMAAKVEQILGKPDLFPY